MGWNKAGLSAAGRGNSKARKDRHYCPHPPGAVFYETEMSIPRKAIDVL